jgi:hypothetical protein
LIQGNCGDDFNHLARYRCMDSKTPAQRKQELQDLLKQAEKNAEESRLLQKAFRASITLIEFETIRKSLEKFTNVRVDEKHHQLIIKTKGGEIIVGVRWDDVIFMEINDRNIDLNLSPDQTPEEIAEHIVGVLEKLICETHEIKLSFKLTSLLDHSKNPNELVETFVAGIKSQPVLMDLIQDLNASVNTSAEFVLEKPEATS